MLNVKASPLVPLSDLGDFLCFFVSVYVYCIAVFCVLCFFWVFFAFVASFHSAL